MPLSAADREVIFGTPVISYQIQLYLLKCPECRTSGKNLRMTFSDLSKAAFTTAMISLESKGIVAIDGMDVVLVPEKVNIRGVILNRCWKAMRIERKFTVKSITELTGYNHKQVREAIRSLTKQKAIGIVFKAPRKPVVYQVITDSVLRPAPEKKRQSDSLVQRAWKLAGKLGSFSFADLSEICKISNRYAKELISAFKSSGYIEEIGTAEDGHTKLYRMKEAAPEEPPVVKNRTRINRLGY